MKWLLTFATFVLEKEANISKMATPLLKQMTSNGWSRVTCLYPENYVLHAYFV